MHLISFTLEGFTLEGFILEGVVLWGFILGRGECANVHLLYRFVERYVFAIKNY